MTTILALILGPHLSFATISDFGLQNKETFMVWSLAGVLAGAVLMMGYQRWRFSVRKIRWQEQADEILNTANRESESLRAEMLVDAKEASLKLKTEAEREIAELRKPQALREQKLDRRQEVLEQQEDALRKQQRGLESSQLRLDAQLREVATLKQQLEASQNEQSQILQRASGMSREQATAQLMESLSVELEHELSLIHI